MTNGSRRGGAVVYLSAYTSIGSSPPWAGGKWVRMTCETRCQGSPNSPGRRKAHDPRRAEDDERFAAGRVGGVLERVHEHRQLPPRVGVEGGQDDVRDLMPGQPELREPVQGAGPAVEQDPEVAALDPVTGCGAAG